MKVMFEPLPKESLRARIFRVFARKHREQEHIHLSMNGHNLVIKRGVAVDVPDWVPEVAAYGATLPHAIRYDCFVEREKPVDTD